MRTASILVVENSLRFRAREGPDVQVASEASNGLKAMRRGSELNPDLVVMDIDLPELSGIEAGRRIRKLARRSRIIFLNQEGSAEVVEESLNLSALVYVHKTRAGNELFPAFAAFLEGKQFCQ